MANPPQRVNAGGRTVTSMTVLNADDPNVEREDLNRKLKSLQDQIDSITTTVKGRDGLDGDDGLDGEDGAAGADGTIGVFAGRWINGNGANSGEAEPNNLDLSLPTKVIINDTDFDAASWTAAFSTIVPTDSMRISVVGSYTPYGIYTITLVTPGLGNTTFDITPLVAVGTLAGGEMLAISFD